jgi:arylsulfatase A-like enzyme
MKRPNIVLIITDQQRWDMMSCAGNKYLRTPHMDYLAKNGLRFQNAYCSNPVCAPSRFGILTGKMPGEVNFRSDYDRNIRITSDILDNGIAKKLREEGGYDTVYAGKDGLRGIRVTDLGFNVISSEGRDKTADTCRDYILNSEKPFFMVASFLNPHDICYMAIYDFIDHMGEEKKSFLPPGQEYERIEQIKSHKDEIGEDIFYTDICPPLPDNYLPQNDEPEMIERLLKQRYFRYMARTTYTDEQWRMHRYVYAKLTEAVDSQIGVLIKALQEKGIEKNTVILFTGDHGDMDASHKMEHKSALYEEAMRIPFVISDPNAKRVGVCNDLVSNGLDIYPTICDYAGVEVPKNLKGMSLKPLLDGKDIEKREYLKVESEIGDAVVTPDYKYVLYFDGANREQLYDLNRNPWEMCNDALDPYYQTVLEKMRTLFKEAVKNQ